MARLKLTHPQFRHAPAAICGSGSVRALADLDDGETVFLTSGQNTVNEIVSSALARKGGTLTRSNNARKVDGEPTFESVSEAAEFLRSRSFHRVVAVGGGSVLDWARLAWAQSIGALDVETGKLLADPGAAPRPEFWLVPTTCGTGAEAADVAVFRSGSGRKAAVVSPAFLADKVVLDGRFLETIASSTLATFVADALTHAIEASLSLVPLQLGKEAALSALHLIVSSYPEKGNSSRNDRLMEAGFLGGIAAANCSVGIVHAFAHSVGVDGLSHGLANACALNAGIEFNADTPQMEILLQRMRLRSPENLIHQIQPIVDAALERIGEHPVIARLNHGDYQLEIASRMATDTAIRSNPRRATEDETLNFVRSVATRVAAA